MMAGMSRPLSACCSGSSRDGGTEEVRQRKGHLFRKPCVKVVLRNLSHSVPRDAGHKGQDWFVLHNIFGHYGKVDYSDRDEQED